MSSNSPLADLNNPNHRAGSGATRESFDRTKRRSITYECDWNSWANKLLKESEQEERYFDEIKYREGLRNQLYYENQFFFRISEETGQVHDLPHTDVDPFFPHNYFRYFVDLSVAAACEASPDIIIDPTRNDDRNISAAKSAKYLGDYLERELITPQFKLETEKTRQLYGGVWWYSYWSLDAGKLFAEDPVYTQTIHQDNQQYFMCDCGEAGPIERLFPTQSGEYCPGCMRSDRLNVMQSPATIINEVVGHEKRPLGFPCVECVSPLQMKGDRRGHYMNGQYLIRKRLVDRDVVAERIPWWDETRGSADYNEISVRAEEIARRPSTAAYRTGASLATLGSYDRDRQDILVTQFWLQPSKYAHVQFDHDIEFIGEESTTIPAHTPLGEVFPKALYLLKVGDEWLDHREEDFRKKFVYIPYIYLPNKSDGDSLKDMCEPQLEIIHMRSLLYLYLLARAGGGPTIIKPPLAETFFDGSPQTITRLPAGFDKPISELFFQPAYPPADPNLSAYVNQMAGEMQIMSQTVSPTSVGDPAAQQLGGDTARAAMIMNSKAQGLQGPKLMPMAFAQAQAVTQWIELYRENVHDDIPIPLKGKTGLSEWRTIKSSDLEGDFFIYPRAASWLPRPREERQAALQNAFASFGQVLIDPNSPQELVEEIKDAYGLEFSTDSTQLDKRDAMLKIEQMKDMIPQALELADQLSQMQMIPPDPQTGEMPDPMTIVGQILAQAVKPDEDLDDPPTCVIYMTYFKIWLKSDEGKEETPFLQAGVRSLFKLYKSVIDAAQQQQEQIQQEQMKQLQQDQDNAESQKRQSQMQSKQQDHINKMQQDQQRANIDKQKRDSESKNRLKEMIAKSALEQAQASGHELPVSGKALVPRLSDVPSQPLF